MDIVRGYVKYMKDGVFRKELLTDHPELLAKATPEQQIAAEEARRLHEAAVEYEKTREAQEREEQLGILEALKEAPEDVLVATQLTTVTEDGETLYLPVEEAQSIAEVTDDAENKQS